MKRGFADTAEGQIYYTEAGAGPALAATSRLRPGRAADAAGPVGLRGSSARLPVIGLQQGQRCGIGTGLQ